MVFPGEPRESHTHVNISVRYFAGCIMQAAKGCLCFDSVFLALVCTQSDYNCMTVASAALVPGPMLT